MALKVFRTNSKYLCKEKLLRCNYKTVSLSKDIEDILGTQLQNARIKDYFYIVNGYAFKSEDYVLDGIPLIRIGDLGDDLNYGNTVRLPDDYLEQFSKYELKVDDILVSLTGDGRIKTALVKQNGLLLNQRVGALRAKVKCNILFYHYLINCSNVKKQFLWHSNGKTQLNISPFDFVNIKIPVIPEDVQSKILTEINVYEEEITKLKLRKKPIQKIIDEVLERDLKLNVTQALEFDNTTVFSMGFDALDNVNLNLRFSFRWNKLQQVQEILLQNVGCVKKLGKFIHYTKNGWSPICTENASTYSVLGIDAINKDGVLSFENPKFTNETKNNIQNFIIKEGDFFISRGNTTDLVALASIAPQELASEYIYPDLMIKIDFDQEQINKEYLAYTINSIVGRLYFKYAAKGKNQTMVKISSTEINDFLLPIPNIELQQRIVDEIKVEIDKQNTIKKEITKLRDTIDIIMEEAIMRYTRLS